MAGVLGFQVLEEIDLDALEAMLRPKVIGPWILHQLTQDIKLEFFVSFSSIASVWGSQGLGHYAAANQCRPILQERLFTMQANLEVGQRLQLFSGWLSYPFLSLF